MAFERRKSERMLGVATRRAMNTKIPHGRGYVSLIEKEFDSNSNIDPVCLEKEINQAARIAFASGRSKLSAAVAAINVYLDDLKRLMPKAFEREGVIFARIEGYPSAMTQKQ